MSERVDFVQLVNDLVLSVSEFANGPDVVSDGFALHDLVFLRDFFVVHVQLLSRHVRRLRAVSSHDYRLHSGIPAFRKRFLRLLPDRVLDSDDALENEILQEGFFVVQNFVVLHISVREEDHSQRFLNAENLNDVSDSVPVDVLDISVDHFARALVDQNVWRALHVDSVASLVLFDNGDHSLLRVFERVNDFLFVFVRLSILLQVYQKVLREFQQRQVDFVSLFLLDLI